MWPVNWYDLTYFDVTPMFSGGGGNDPGAGGSDNGASASQPTFYWIEAAMIALYIFTWLYAK